MIIINGKKYFPWLIEAPVVCVVTGLACFISAHYSRFPFSFAFLAIGCFSILSGVGMVYSNIKLGWGWHGQSWRSYK